MPVPLLRKAKSANSEDLYELNLQSALTNACFYGYHAAIASLLKRGACVNMEDERGYMPLHMACQEGHLRTVKVLLEAGADPELKDKESEPALFYAVGSGRLRTVQFLIKRGVDVNVRCQGSDRGSPLHTACVWNRFKVAAALINAGADIDAVDASNRTPIMFAIMGDHVDLVRLLIARGANLLRMSQSGKSPLKIAKARGNKLILSILRASVTH